MKSVMWARRAYLLGMVLAVVLFIPVSSFPLITGKLAAVAACLLVAGLLYLWAFVRGAAEPLPGAPLLFALLPLSYALSFAFSIDRAVGLVGTGIETDTILFVTLAFVAALLGAMLFKTAGQARTFVRTLFFAFGAATLFQIVVLLVGLPGPFADRSVNLIGKWNDFGMVLLFLASYILVEFESGRLNSRMRLIGGLALAVLLVLLGVVNFATVWALLLVVALAVAATTWVSSRRIAWGSALAALIAVAFLFFGAALNAQLSKVVPVTSLEVRPSLQSTLQVTTAAHGSSVKAAALGTGPNTFGLSWLTHKPAEINQSQFWNLDFTVGYSTLATALSSVGFVGVLAWLLPALLVLGGLWRARRIEEGRGTLWMVACAALVWWALIMLYVPSPSLLLIAFATMGIAVGLLWQGSWAVTRRATLLLAYAVFALILIVSAGAALRRFAAEEYVGMASAALQAKDAAGAQTLVARSIAIEPTTENLRFMTDAGVAQLQAIAAANSTADSVATFTALLQSTIAAGQRALALDPLDYRSYVSLGRLYSFLAANKVTGAYDSAKAAYTSAATLSPQNPSIPLMQAQLEGSAGTVAGLQESLKRALTLKPDYTDAILYLAQVDIARNDLASAVQDTQVAARTAPGVPSIWLQLGLLYYAGGDTKDAIAPFEQALQLQPDYANAQYFLGLSYAAQGRTQEATALFEKLASTNPDSAEVKAILANLQAGRAPLYTPTATTTPIK